MKLHQLPKLVKKPAKRLGRGYGSGKGGHTTGRGSKGRRARGKVTDWFEGGQLPQIRRFPFIRGKSRFKPLGQEIIAINVSRLNQFKSQAVISPKSLVAAGLLNPSKLHRVQLKIVGSGKLTVPLTVKLPTSQIAKQKIEAAGGKVTSGDTD